MLMKPSIPKGTRDFSPAEMAKRNYIFDTIRSVFYTFGFQPIETPAMENLSTLMGKYGEEGDKLLFKVLNSGNFLEKIDASQTLTPNLSPLTLNHLAAQLCEKGLRYDLTVPFARYVVMHRDEITLPFKRFQMQPVWRADRPQRGRYREFYQCDADIVGTDSLLCEVDLVQMIDTVFRALGIRVAIHINNRKILSGIAEVIGQADKLIDITVAIDKLDKIGLENVNAELAEKGLPADAIAKLQPIILLSGTDDEKLATLRTLLAASETGMKGIEETEFILRTARQTLALTPNPSPLTQELVLDLTLARGLNYYTGAIFEVKALDAEMGSISGGGRYDNLTGIFGLPGVSGVGISFGADRIYDVLTQLDLFPAAATRGTRVLFVNFGDAEAAYCLPLLSRLRAAGHAAELYPDAAKMKKQMAYANALGIPYVVIVGQDEMSTDRLSVKDMQTGQQSSLTIDELIAML
ncbi:MAG: histidine--tRNA ligase [Bacteroidaceae bacterium]|nr:histidine--tRNA ligase [Bacteroidaceae bacterium]